MSHLSLPSHDRGHPSLSRSNSALRSVSAWAIPGSTSRDPNNSTSTPPLSSSLPTGPLSNFRLSVASSPRPVSGLSAASSSGLESAVGWSVLKTVLPDGTVENRNEGEERGEDGSGSGFQRRGRTTVRSKKKRRTMGWKSPDRSRVSGFSNFSDVTQTVSEPGLLSPPLRPHQPGNSDITSLEDDQLTNSSDSSTSSEDENEFIRHRTVRHFTSGTKLKTAVSLPTLTTTEALAPTYFQRFISTLRGDHWSQNTKDLIKCSFGYLLGSLFTFVPALSSLLSRPFDLEGPASNAHVVATIAVYFAPNRTAGGMVEADFYTALAFCYAVILLCGSMGTTNLMNILGLERVGHALVVLFWVGCGYGLLAWSKFVMAKPTFNTACSMVVLLTSTVITREAAIHDGHFNLQPILRSLEIVLIGISISNVLCFSFWSASSVTKLQNDLNKTLASFSTLLEMLTTTFLLTNSSYSETALVKAIAAHNASFTSLTASFGLAQLEFLDQRTMDHLHSYKRIVGLMKELAQHISGLRSGCTLQRDIMKAKIEGMINDGDDSKTIIGREGSPSPAISPASPSPMISVEGKSWEKEEMRLSNEVMVFESFRTTVGPSLKRITGTSKRALKRLQTSFLNSQRGEAALARLRSQHADLDKQFGGDDDAENLLEDDGGEGDLSKLKTQLLTDLEAYRLAHSTALTKIYRYSSSERTLAPPEFLTHGQQRRDQQSSASSFRSSVGAGGDGGAEDDDDGGPNEEVFLLYFFLYTIEEFVQDLVELLDVFMTVREQEEKAEKVYIARSKKWWFVRIWEGIILEGKRNALNNFNHVFPNLIPKNTDESPFPISDSPAITSHATDVELSGWRKFKRMLWYFGYRVKQPDIVYGFKTGLGAACLVIPAFISSIRPSYVQYKGWWALVSYMVVTSPSVGQTNYMAVHRLVGSIAGAAVAIAFYEVFPEDPVILPILGWLFCLPCFWIVVNYPAHAPTARFVLLTYNLTCLSTYNQRELDVSHVTVGLMRMVSVIVGVGWSFFITRFVLPYEARKELRKGLSQWLLNSAHLYERIVRSYSYNPSAVQAYGSKRTTNPSDETWPLSREETDRLNHSFDDVRRMVLHQRIHLLTLSTLLNQTSNEPRLKGPFPVAKYREVLSHCQNILDLFHSIQCVVSRPSWHKNVIMDFVIPVNKYRREMVGNVILFFSLLASTIWLKTPMPPYLPPAETSRQRLATKIRSLPVVRQRAVRGSPDYLLYFAYVVAMKQVIDELEDLGRDFESLFGIIGGFHTREMFEAMFMAHDVHVVV